MSDKGLKSGAIGLMSTPVIGVASTAPGYSLASSLTAIAAAANAQMDHIVLGYDGSKDAHAALRAAALLTEQLGASLHLVFCYKPPALLAGGNVGEQRDEICRIGRSRLDDGLRTLEGRAMTVEGELVDASLEGLIAAGEQYSPVMIVVGHHGEGPLRGALLGATANKLLNQAERPVLVVPATESLSPPRPTASDRAEGLLLGTP